MISDARTAYLDASIATASPARLLVMLFDRLVLDCRRAIGQLVHAQEIVLELRSSLDTAAWDGGPGLASLYDYLHTRLIRANVGRDAEVTEHCLGLVTNLAQTWREAALQAAQQAAQPVGA